MFQHRGGDQTNISGMEKGFQQGLMRIKLKEVGLIPDGVEEEEDMILRRSLIRGLTTEVLNNGLESSVIELNNRWRKRERKLGGGRIGSEYWQYFIP